MANIVSSSVCKNYNPVKAGNTSSNILDELLVNYSYKLVNDLSLLNCKIDCTMVQFGLLNKIYDMLSDPDLLKYISVANLEILLHQVNIIANNYGLEVVNYEIVEDDEFNVIGILSEDGDYYLISEDSTTTSESILTQE